MMPIAEAARASFPSRDLGQAQAGDVRHGRQIDADLGGLTALFAPDGEFLALYEPSHGTTRAVAVFV
jgi:tRNA pseudouridine55 synthase